MSCWTKDSIDETLIIAEKIGYNPPHNTPGAPNWQKLAEKINARHSFPVPPDTVYYTGATARQHWAGQLYRLTETDRWRLLTLDDEILKGAVETYNLTVWYRAWTEWGAISCSNGDEMDLEHSSAIKWLWYWHDVLLEILSRYCHSLYKNSGPYWLVSVTVEFSS